MTKGQAVDLSLASFISSQQISSPAIQVTVSLDNAIIQIKDMAFYGLSTDQRTPKFPYLRVSLATHLNLVSQFLGSSVRKQVDIKRLCQQLQATEASALYKV